LSWGKLKIRYELQLKKLDSEVIVKVLDEFDDQKYIEKLAILLERKKRTIRARSDTELIQKLFRYAMPKGFSGDEIQEALNYLMNNEL
jgi:regulatory protein